MADLRVPHSLPPEKQASTLRINEDEYENILLTVKDDDLGVEGGEIEETEHLENSKERAKSNEEVSDDKESTLHDEARKRVQSGNNNYDVQLYILKKGEDLRNAALSVYGNADGWVLLAAANNIINPSSSKEVYEGKELIVI